MSLPLQKIDSGIKDDHGLYDTSHVDLGMRMLAHEVA